jgi:CRISPR-associated protein Csd2
MTLRRLIVFKHTGEHPELGSAPAHELFDLVKVERVKGEDGADVPRAYGDYKVRIAEAPEGIEIIEKR